MRDSGTNRAGVHYDEIARKYRVAFIAPNGKLLLNGFYSTEEKALEVYREIKARLAFREANEG
jgi:hypothetical protein